MLTRTPEKILRQAIDAYTFRAADLGDVEVLVEIYGEYFTESFLPGLGLAYDPERARAKAIHRLPRGDYPHILAFEKKTGTLVGLVSYNVNQDYTTEPFASLYKLYVRPKWRRSPIGRVLMMLCLDVAKADGAVAFHIALTSGMVESRSFANLLGKLGFELTDGVIMMRRLSDE